MPHISAAETFRYKEKYDIANEKLLLRVLAFGFTFNTLKNILLKKKKKKKKFTVKIQIKQ